jgi:putative hydrolase of the HAD superfamily
MLKTVFFDLGNVLVFFSHEKMFAQVGNLANIPVHKVKEIFAKEKIMARYEQGLMESQEVYETLRSHSSQRFSFEELMHHAADIFTPNFGVWEIVKALKDSKKRLVLISNTSECHYNFIRSHYPILDLFDAKILSFEVQSMKPEPLIYQKALGQAKAEPKECFFTDDIPEYVEGARKAGLDSEIFTDTSSLRSQLSLRGCSI